MGTFLSCFSVVVGALFSLFRACAAAVGPMSQIQTRRDVTEKIKEGLMKQTFVAESTSGDHTT